MITPRPYLLASILSLAILPGCRRETVRADEVATPPSAAASPARITTDASASPVASAKPRVCPHMMATIPGGSFAMGSDARSFEKPIHKVTLPTFCLDVAEVTVRQYAECSTCSPAATKVNLVFGWPGDVVDNLCNAGARGKGEHPINCVTWEQARAFCAARDARLPTEEEWEYAARGGAEQREYPWGNDGPSLGGSRYPRAQLCWARDMAGEGHSGTCEVQSFPAEAFGLHDLGGNVSEWTANLFCPYGMATCGDTDRAIRGGEFRAVHANNTTSAFRSAHPPNQATPVTGFRCARDL